MLQYTFQFHLKECLLTFMKYCLDAGIIHACDWWKPDKVSSWSDSYGTTSHTNNDETRSQKETAQQRQLRYSRSYRRRRKWRQWQRKRPRMSSRVPQDAESTVVQFWSSFAPSSSLTGSDSEQLGAAHQRALPAWLDLWETAGDFLESALLKTHPVLLYFELNI